MALAGRLVGEAGYLTSLVGRRPGRMGDDVLEGWVGRIGAGFGDTMRHWYTPPPAHRTFLSVGGEVEGAE